MILVLHGAIKNAGDFLIRDRGLALLTDLLPNATFEFQERWKSIDPELARSADAIVLCGGPGLAEDFYPEKFRLVEHLETLRVPILPLALGWSGKGSIDEFALTAKSQSALRIIHEHIDWSSVRDDLTLGLMQRVGVGDVKRTGCNAWYHLPSLGRSLQAPSSIRRLVFTTPADMRNTFEVLRVLRLLARRYSSSDRFCVFHRGIRADVHTSRKTAAANRLIALVASQLDYRIVDASYDASNIDFYESCDLHVGYRVHAHLAFLSFRRPSLLVSEDGRGRGQAATLHDPYTLVAREPNLVERLNDALDKEHASGFGMSAKSVDEIERSWPLMKATIEQLRPLNRS